MVAEQVISPLSILLVDDEPAIREVFTRFLARRGHSVIACATAEHGLEVAQQRKGEIDVVVTDLILPDMSGLDLARGLLACAPNARVILLTGEPNSESADSARELQVHKYLAKPIRAGALIDVVEEAGRLSREAAARNS